MLLSQICFGKFTFAKLLLLLIVVSPEGSSYCCFRKAVSNNLFRKVLLKISLVLKPVHFNISFFITFCWQKAMESVSTMAYAIYGPTSYILEADSKRPVSEKKKRNRIRSCWRNWMGQFFFFSKQKYFVIFNCLLFAFKIIMIKGIDYVQCQRWVIMKLSLKEKHLVIFYVNKKKTCFI